MARVGNAIVLFPFIINIWRKHETLPLLFHQKLLNKSQDDNNRSVFLLTVVFNFHYEAFSYLQHVTAHLYNVIPLLHLDSL